MVNRRGGYKWVQSAPYNGTELCSGGCGNRARFKQKNGKLICNSRLVRCPNMIAARSQPDSDLTGQSIGYWTVIRWDRCKGWLCQCTCGVEKYVRAQSLSNGDSQSCGCKRRELVSQAAQKDKGHRANSSIFNNYKGAAKRRGFEWALSFEGFCEYLHKPCFYCGVEPDSLWNDHYMDRTDIEHFCERQDFYYNGVDRVDNTQGYIPSNCVTACKACNLSKNTMSEGTWLQWVKRVYEFQHLEKGG